MTLKLDISLTPDELQELRATDPRLWFTWIRFRNGESPRHPAYENFDAIYQKKREMVFPG